jgi:hypothetical protein
MRTPARAAHLLGGAALLCLPVLVAAQQKQPLIYDAGAAQTRTVHDQRIAVDDVPDHVLRFYDVRRAFTGRAPVFDGVRAIEMWEQGVADTVDRNGSESAYITYVLENGEKVLGRYAGVVQSFRWPDGSRHYDHVGSITLTGGSGRFAGMRGLIRVRAAVDPGADSNQIESKGEYWFLR